MATQGKRRALGQHFLVNDKVRTEIAQTAVLEARKLGCVALLEIGPGKGAITEKLMSAKDALPLYIVEKDHAFATRWRNEMENSKGRIRDVTDADFTELPLDKWLPETPLAIASNLPYSAGTAIFTQLAARPSDIPVMVLMFQKEVADRLLAAPSTADRGSLSVWSQNQWEITRLMNVPPGAFLPPPAVMSAVVVCKARAKPMVEGTGTDDPGAEQWQQLLKVAFTHRRKMLRSGLPSTGPWKEALTKSGIDPTLRPEALGWDEWRALFGALKR